MIKNKKGNKGKFDLIECINTLLPQGAVITSIIMLSLAMINLSFGGN